MLSKKYRLSSTDIEHIKEHSSRAHSPFFTILYKKNNKEFPRIAVIISKKISKKAVRRNAIRRLLKAKLKEKIDSLPNQDYVVIVKTGTEIHEKAAEELINLITTCR